MNLNSLNMRAIIHASYKAMRAAYEMATIAT